MGQQARLAHGERACFIKGHGLIKMPCLAATPVPAMMATGVAKPNAQGQAMTNTATAWMSAVSKSVPVAIQAPRVSRAINSTTGTNTSATLSTSR